MRRHLKMLNISGLRFIFVSEHLASFVINLHGAWELVVSLEWHLE
jgi:hypothetical protein